MDTSKLKKFAQLARRTLMGQVGAKLDSVLAPGAAARREQPEAMKKLETAIARDGKGQVIERVAYTWFNRFSALRYMDVNDLNPVRVVSPLSGQFQPEILAEAKAGNIDDDRVPEKIRTQVRALLDGRAPSSDAQAEAYRLLLVAICNDWHRVMPFLFERIDDYTELLLPADLLSNTSILAYLREAMTPDVCEDVEVIGWLYQFYISEKKDEVFAGLKKNVKIAAENIPAATQLFTPHWIVRYLVENSLGRLWMLNRPSSRLKERMDYYIAPGEPETDFLRISSPEEIRVCDPACGSGHMLTYAFDLLHTIYEEEGYDAAEIPSLILARNLYGIEIDERAGALAAFALTMKAAARRKQFLRRAGKDGLQPNVCVLENVTFKDEELDEYMKGIGRDLLTADLRETLGQFEQAKNFGSLIVPKLKEVAELRRMIAEKHFENNLFLRDVHERVLTVLRMAEVLSPNYQVVVANPPYMGGKGMNPRLKSWLRDQYPKAKSDLMTCFMERCHELNLASGYWAMINLPSWMFLGSYDEVRSNLLRNQRITSLLHLGRGLFGPDFGTVAFSVQSCSPNNSTKGVYRRLFERQVNVRRPEEIERLFLDKNYNVFVARQADLLRIPGLPIAYWLSDEFTSSFAKNRPFKDFFESKQGLATGNNDRFLRFWHEVAVKDMDLRQTNSDEFNSESQWFPYSKGGEARKWYGNNELVILWADNGKPLKNFKDDDGNRLSTLKNLSYMFRPAITWSLTSIGGILCTRFRPSGFVFDTNGMSAFSSNALVTEQFGVALLNSRFAQEVLKVLNPTMAFQSGDIDRVPMPSNVEALTDVVPAEDLILIGKSDWDAYETSWDFTTLPLLSPDHRADTLEGTYSRLRGYWQRMTEEMRRLEEANNRAFLHAYGLQDELTPEVSLEEITLTCNPAYRYGGKKTVAELENLMRADTMREFLSYAVGCMFGRYSLDEPGLVLANQGDGRGEYLAKVPEPTFAPDADNVIPILDDDWFADDITERFRKFLRTTFGETYFQENVAFIEEALGKKLRSYFTRDFYADHVQRYKKRPIYWLFSSPKGTFNALMYMHRYRPDTVSVVLNDYLREFRNKLEGHRRAQEALSISGEASPAQKTKALKEIEATGKQIEELDAWERDVLFPLATQKIEIDLDDGVKANYPQFGAALKPIKGLNDADD
jgi:hypothetical protein